MAAFVTVFDIVAHTLGLLNIFLAALLYARDRDRLYIRELLLMAGFACIVLFQSIDSLGLDLPAGLRELLAFLAVEASGLISWALPVYISNLEPGRRPKFHDRVWVGIALLSMSGYALVSLGACVVPGWEPGSVEVAQKVVMGICILSIGYTLVLALQAALGQLPWGLGPRQPVSPPAAGNCVETSRISRRPLNETSRLAVRMGILTLVLLPLLLWLDFQGNGLPGQPELAHLRALPVIYFLWSLLLMVTRVRTLLTVPSAALGLGPGARQRLAGCFDISPREGEVMDLLIAGATYAAIANALCISVATVKTHVIRLYRKTGVSNKVELIHLLQIQEKPENQPKG